MEVVYQGGCLWGHVFQRRVSIRCLSLSERYSFRISRKCNIFGTRKGVLSLRHILYWPRYPFTCTRRFSYRHHVSHLV